jgi:ABC-type multidrug transport system, ATPase and permease components
MQTQIEESLSVSGVLLGKTLGTGPTSSERFTERSRELIDLEVRSQLAGRWRMATMSVVFAAIPAVIYLAAGLPVTSGAMTIGTLVAFVALQSQLFRPLSSLLDVGVTVVSSMALFGRIFEYLDLRTEIEEPSRPVCLDPDEVRGEVRLERVGFTYDGSDRPALADVDIAVPAGGSLALVGETGSGKSTLAALVARLYDPTLGRVLIAASTSAGSRWTRSRGSSASCPRRHTCCTPRSARTCAWPSRTPPMPRSKTRPGPRRCTT